uniref:Uncharacterized protein n=1 Tax=Pundamilia nyererei TaxID=303518 RepID=A0A3B4H695_9CICH
LFFSLAEHWLSKWPCSTIDYLPAALTGEDVQTLPLLLGHHVFCEQMLLHIRSVSSLKLNIYFASIASCPVVIRSSLLIFSVFSCRLTPSLANIPSSAFKQSCHFSSFQLVIQSSCSISGIYTCCLCGGVVITGLPVEGQYSEF